MTANTHPASRTVHTPTGPVHCCAKHAAKLVGIMSFMGAQSPASSAPADAQCSNCVNEAKVREHA